MTDVLSIHPHDSDERVALAAQLLADSGGVVMLADVLALRSTGHEIVCEGGG